jgi:hypothetical protein
MPASSGHLSRKEPGRRDGCTLQQLLCTTLTCQHGMYHEGGSNALLGASTASSQPALDRPD